MFHTKAAKHARKNSSPKDPQKNHPEFWAQTRYGKHSAPAYDTVDRLRPQGRENFLRDLNQESHHLPRAAHFSKVNPELLVTPDKWVISLVRKKDHAVIVMETVGYGDDEGLYVRWFDFLPKNRPHAPRGCFGLFTNFKALENRAVAGMVRYCPTNRGNPLANVPDSITKKELFAKLNWHEDTDSWVCSPAQVKSMMENINNDFLLSDEEKLKFQFSSDSIPNCTTWTWHKLEAAGIRADNDNYQNKLIVRASKNIGTKRTSLKAEWF